MYCTKNMEIINFIKTPPNGLIEELEGTLRELNSRDSLYPIKIYLLEEDKSEPSQSSFINPIGQSLIALKTKLN